MHMQQFHMHISIIIAVLISVRFFITVFSFFELPTIQVSISIARIAHLVNRQLKFFEIFFALKFYILPTLVKSLFFLHKEFLLQNKPFFLNSLITFAAHKCIFMHVHR